MSVLDSNNGLNGKRILIIGLGLIGGSIARGLSGIGSCRILACGRNQAVLETAQRDGSIHAYSTRLADVAAEADLVIIATPTLTVRAVLEELRNVSRSDAVITDAASVKGSVVADGRELLAGSLHRFVPGHPIAGSEKSGYQASRPDLYQRRKVILTPLPESSDYAVNLVTTLWESLQAQVHTMSVECHDRVLAGTSHLPHLLAYALVNTLTDTLDDVEQGRQVFDYAAGGFADFSRIASSDPVMWRDIFLSNGSATLELLDAYMQSLEELRALIVKGDGQSMQAEFSRAKSARDDFIRRYRDQS